MFKKAFTLAEILITLTVIGIVAAITLPALNQNINDRAFKTQKKALLVRITNAISDMPSVKGFGEYKTVKNEETGENELVDTMAESFIVDGLSKIYKMTNICEAGQLEKCGLPPTFAKLNGSKIDLPKDVYTLANAGRIDGMANTSAAAFETTNGEKIAVYYYNNCTSKPSWYGGNQRFSPRVCVTFLYDLNGLKSPNQIGQDMGIISVVYSLNGNLNVVAPDVYSKGIIGTAPSYSASGVNASAMCKAQNKELRLPSVDEAAALVLSNKIFYEEVYRKSFITSSAVSVGPKGTVWRATHYTGSENGYATEVQKSAENSVLCVWE